MSIPLVDLRAQYASIKPEIDAAVQDVFAKAAFVLGPAVKDFEQKFAPYCRVKYVAGVSSGTSALLLALRALEIGPGDEVIVPAMTFVATAAAVAYTGAKPVFVDVDETCTLDPTKVEAAITPNTKLILPVHLYGQCADMGAIKAVAQRHGLKILEDCAQAHGAEYMGQRAGSMGVMGCYSFYPGKNLGAYGDGGAIVTNDETLDHKVRLLRDWGCEVRYHHDILAFNARLDGAQGAVLGVKMKYIEEWTEKRRAAANYYRDKLQDFQNVELPNVGEGRRHVYHIFAILVNNRDAVVEKMQKAGIGIGIHYPIAVPLQKCFSELGYRTGQFPMAEKIARMEMTLPIYPEITRSQQDEVLACLKATL